MLLKSSSVWNTRTSLFLAVFLVPTSWPPQDTWSSYQSQHSMDRPVEQKSLSYQDLATGKCTLEDLSRDFQMNGMDSPYTPIEDRIWSNRAEGLSGLGPAGAYCRQASWPAPERSPAPRLPRPRSEWIPSASAHEFNPKEFTSSTPVEAVEVTMLDVSAITTILLASVWKGAVFPPQAKLTNNTYFDYIIAGAGTAGCALARRLLEDQTCTVLLLEDGKDPNAIAMAPGLFFLQPKSPLDYDYKSTPDLYAFGQGNKTRLTSGRVLGGSSSLNHLLHIRPSISDFDTWADLTGDDSWKYKNFLSYFKKSEGLKDPELAENYDDYHGTEGPIGISRLLNDDEMVKGFLKAQAEAGNRVVDDLNSDTNTGYTQPQYTIARNNEGTVGGVRQTTAYSYLYPVKNHSNLYVSKETRVIKIIVEGKTAVGVEVVYKGDTYTFKANKEVILSAGAFNSPQILQLSGIGPKDHLESLGIEVVADLPVGNSLRIPSAVCITTKTKKHLLPLNIKDLLPALKPTQLPFPVIQGSGAWNKSSNIPNHQSYNLMLAHDTPFLLIACQFVYGYSSEICLSWQKQIASRDAIYSVLVNLEAKSTGTVRLNSTDPFDSPIITTGFYNNVEDLETLVTSLIDFTSVVDSPSYKEIGAEVVGVDFSECAHLKYGTRDFWKCYIVYRTISPFLWYGTCAMGSVVDNDFKVLGFDNLRQVDAGVIPVRMRGAINSVVIALAEKAADKIKKTGDGTA